MIHLPATSTSRVFRGSWKSLRVPTDSIRPPRTTTTASGSAGPPVPSIKVAPTSATPSIDAGLHPISSRMQATKVWRPLMRITRGVIVEDLPPIAPALHDQGERAARSNLRSTLKNEPGCHQSQHGTEWPRLDLLEVQAVPPNFPRESGLVYTADEVDAAASTPTIDEGGCAFPR